MTVLLSSNYNLSDASRDIQIANMPLFNTLSVILGMPRNIAQYKL